MKDTNVYRKCQLILSSFFVFSSRSKHEAHLKCIIFFSNHLKKGKGQHLKGFNPDETYLKGTLRHILLMLDSLESATAIYYKKGDMCSVAIGHISYRTHIPKTFTTN